MKTLVKQACIGFSIAALLGSLAACSGSGSPAAAPANNNTDGGNTGGGGTGGEKPCIDVSLGTPNILLPVLPKIKYQYSITNGDAPNSVSTNLEYGCADSVPNGTKKVYPLNYELTLDAAKPDESFTVNEFISSQPSAIKLHGYKIVDVPLSIISEGTKGKINVDIFPENPLQLTGVATETIGEYEHNYGVTKLVFKDLVIDDLYDALQTLFLSLKKEGKAFKDIPEATITLGIGILKTVKFNPFASGLPVNGSGSAIVSSNQESLSWRGEPHTAVITTVKQTMNFTVGSNQIFDQEILDRLKFAKINLDFSFNIKVNASYKLEPNVGPVERVYTVDVIDNNAKEEVKSDTDTAESEEKPTFSATIKLESIVNGDSDNDFIMDVVDDNIDTAETTK